MILRIFLALLWVGGPCWAITSGLYVDNGFDQTVIQQVLTTQEKRKVEGQLLDLLGLEDRPRAVPRGIMYGSAPKFLLDVYSSLSHQDEEEQPLADQPLLASEFNLSKPDINAITQSDVIMSFTVQKRHVGNVRHERGKRLWFDVSKVPIGSEMMGAELRLYQTPNCSLPRHRQYTLTMYTVLDNHRDKELEYVDSVNTTGDHSGWLVFNMTGAVSNWLDMPESNKGLYLSLHTTHRNSGKELLPEEIGVTTLGSGEKEPFLVVFLRSGPGGNRPLMKQGNGGIGRRQRRQTGGGGGGRRRKKTADSSYLRNPLTDRPWSRAHKSCQLQTLYVSFKDLKWEDWIIAPAGYEAFYCSGECNFPLNAVMNATNHAVVQTLVHLMNPLQVPKPCCAPTKLSTISVLFLHDTSNVMVKKYKNMVVKSCGCH